VNESIHRHRELTMTVICKTCDNQYGAWRPHCPVCRTATPKKAHEEATPRVRREVTRRVKEYVVRESKTLCVFCRQRGAKQRCTHCNELIHGTCVGLHAPECIKFQQERDAAITRLSQGGTS
jgi:hypothetical protein